MPSPRKTLIMSVLLLLSLCFARPAFPWGAFRGVLGLKVTDTHQQIMRAAFDLVSMDPGMSAMFGIPIHFGRTATFEDIVQYEGVNGDIRTLSPVGPGPDADGSTPYSWHWFNPLTGRGQGPQAAAMWYEKFAQSINQPAGNDEDSLRGLAWAAHFVADMFVPYHVNGMPATEEAARMAARNFIIGEAEAGPGFLWSACPSDRPDGGGNLFDQLDASYSVWKRQGWGVDSDFSQSMAIFEANRQAAGVGRQENPLDWFDPWYWNGSPAKTIVLTPYLSDLNSDPGRAVLSSHASYEALAHARFIQFGGYRKDFNRPYPYDSLWKNAPPDYEFSGQAWQAQAWQVQDFAARAALRTRQNVELYWRYPERAIYGAVEAVYTIWRSAYSALRPVIQVGRDPARPNDGLVVQVTIQNLAYEACHDARLRMRMEKDGSVVVQEVQAMTAPITNQGGGQMSWFVRVNPNEDWTVVAEVAGIFDATPDLQYAMSSAQYRPEPMPPEIWQPQPKPIEEAEAADLVGQWNISDPFRAFDEYHGTMTLEADGGLRSYERVSGRDLNDTGTWTYDRANRVFSFKIPNGGSFSGTVSGNSADFVVDGTWNNGTRGQMRFRR